MAIDLGQQADAVLQVDGSQALEPALDSDALLGGLGGHLKHEQQPALIFHANKYNETTVTNRVFQ